MTASALPHRGSGWRWLWEHVGAVGGAWLLYRRDDFWPIVNIAHQIEADLAPFVGLLLGLFFHDHWHVAGYLCACAIIFGLVLLTAFWPWYRSNISSCIWLGAVGRGLEGAGFTSIGNRALARGENLPLCLLGAGVIAQVLQPEQAKILTLAVTLSMISTPAFCCCLTMCWRQPARRDGAVDIFDKPARPERATLLSLAWGVFGQIISRVLSARNVPFTALDTSSSQINTC